MSEKENVWERQSMSEGNESGGREKETVRELTNERSQRERERERLRERIHDLRENGTTTENENE